MFPQVPAVYQVLCLAGEEDADPDRCSSHPREHSVWSLTDMQPVFAHQLSEEAGRDEPHCEPDFIEGTCIFAQVGYEPPWGTKPWLVRLGL